LARFDEVVAGHLISGRGFGSFAGGPLKPIKTFARVRTASIHNQLAGQSEGQTLEGTFPGLGPGGGRGPGGPGGFSLGSCFGHSWREILDTNHDSLVTEAEFNAGFACLFDRWNQDHSGRLTLNQLRQGLDQDVPIALPDFGGPEARKPASSAQR
jgi:hypothetical protein